MFKVLNLKVLSISLLFIILSSFQSSFAQVWGCRGGCLGYGGGFNNGQRSVQALQQMLNNAGIKVDTSGTFDLATRNAVMKFQRDNKLQAVDGIPGDETFKRLGAKQSAEQINGVKKDFFPDNNKSELQNVNEILDRAAKSGSVPGQILQTPRQQSMPEELAGEIAEGQDYMGGLIPRQDLPFDLTNVNQGRGELDVRAPEQRTSDDVNFGELPPPTWADYKQAFSNAGELIKSDFQKIVDYITSPKKDILTDLQEKGNQPDKQPEVVQGDGAQDPYAGMTSAQKLDALISRNAEIQAKLDEFNKPANAIGATPIQQNLANNLEKDFQRNQREIDDLISKLNGTNPRMPDEITKDIQRLDEQMAKLDPKSPEYKALNTELGKKMDELQQSIDKAQAPKPPEDIKTANPEQGMQAKAVTPYECFTLDGKTWQPGKGNAIEADSLVKGAGSAIVDAPLGTPVPVPGKREVNKDAIGAPVKKQMATRCAYIKDKGYVPDPKNSKIFNNNYTQNLDINWK